jgi:hypothetical protein
VLWIRFPLGDLDDQATIFFRSVENFCARGKPAKLAFALKCTHATPRPADWATFAEVTIHFNFKFAIPANRQHALAAGDRHKQRPSLAELWAFTVAALTGTYFATGTAVHMGNVRKQWDVVNDAAITLEMN